MNLVGHSKCEPQMTPITPSTGLFWGEEYSIEVLNAPQDLPSPAGSCYSLLTDQERAEGLNTSTHLPTLSLFAPPQYPSWHQWLPRSHLHMEIKQTAFTGSWKIWTSLVHLLPMWGQRWGLSVFDNGGFASGINGERKELFVSFFLLYFGVCLAE